MESGGNPLGIRKLMEKFKVELGALVTIEDMEKIHILRVLKKVKGNQTYASRILGIDKSTMYRKMRKYERERGVKFTVEEFNGPWKKGGKPRGKYKTKGNAKKTTTATDGPGKAVQATKKQSQGPIIE